MRFSIALAAAAASSLVSALPIQPLIGLDANANVNVGGLIKVDAQVCLQLGLVYLNGQCVKQTPAPAPAPQNPSPAPAPKPVEPQPQPKPQPAPKPVAPKTLVDLGVELAVNGKCGWGKQHPTLLDLCINSAFDIDADLTISFPHIMAEVHADVLACSPAKQLHPKLLGVCIDAKVSWAPLTNEQCRPSSWGGQCPSGSKPDASLLNVCVKVAKQVDVKVDAPVVRADANVSSKKTEVDAQVGKLADVHVAASPAHPLKVDTNIKLPVIVDAQIARPAQHQHLVDVVGQVGSNLLGLKATVL